MKLDLKLDFGACFLIFIVFLFCKLNGAIDWSWWLVTAPLWIPGILVIFATIAFIGLCIIDKDG